jgi:hypothetical protein
MIVLDTNVLSEEMKPAPAPAVHYWLSRQSPLELFTTAVTEAEIMYGIAIKPQRKRELETAAQSILALFSGRILPFDSQAAREFAQIAAERRRLGRPIEDFDAQIAAIARARGRTLATRDVGDFADTGVTLIDPSLP